MGFFRHFNFNNINFHFSTKRLGIAIFCALLITGATFAPVINLPHLVVEGLPTDMSGNRFFILSTEVVGILLNLVGLRYWATVLFLLTLQCLVIDLIDSIHITDSLNDLLAKDPTIHYTQHAGLAWGWWLLILGPAIMGWVLVRDYLADRG